MFSVKLLSFLEYWHFYGANICNNFLVLGTLYGSVLLHENTVCETFGIFGAAGKDY